MGLLYVISALGKLTQDTDWERVQGHTGLNSKFQDRLNYRVRSCLRKKKWKKQDGLHCVSIRCWSCRSQKRKTLGFSFSPVLEGSFKRPYHVFIFILVCFCFVCLVVHLAFFVFFCFVLWGISNDLVDQKQSFNKIYTCGIFFSIQKFSWHVLKSLFFIFP